MFGQHFSERLVKLIQEFAKLVISANNKVREPIIYNKIIMNAMNENKYQDSIKERLWNFYQYFLLMRKRALVVNVCLKWSIIQIVEFKDIKDTWLLKIWYKYIELTIPKYLHYQSKKYYWDISSHSYFIRYDNFIIEYHW